MTFRYSGGNGAGGCGNGEQLYFDEREKMRGRSLNPPHNRDRQPPRYDSRNDPRYARDRHTVDRERFSKYHPDDDCDYEDEDIEQQASHMSRRDRMREREKRGSPPHERNMRYSEDRQMGGSPRYMKAGRK